jgi:hypothetical protein
MNELTVVNLGVNLGLQGSRAGLRFTLLLPAGPAPDAVPDLLGARPAAGANAVTRAESNADTGEVDGARDPRLGAGEVVMVPRAV